MATPVEIGARRSGESTSVPLLGHPIGADTGLAVVWYAPVSGSSDIEPVPQGAGGGLQTSQPVPVSLWTSGAAGVAIAAGATIQIVDMVDVTEYEQIRGTLKADQALEITFIWQEDGTYNATRASADDLVSVSASTPQFLITPTYLDYLRINVKNTGGSPTTLYGGITGHYSGSY